TGAARAPRRRTRRARKDGSARGRSVREASRARRSDQTAPLTSYRSPPLRLSRLLPQPPLRDQVLLRDAEEVAHGVIEVQPRREAEEQDGHEHRHEIDHHLRLRDRPPDALARLGY